MGEAEDLLARLVDDNYLSKKGRAADSLFVGRGDRAAAAGPSPLG